MNISMVTQRQSITFNGNVLSLSMLLDRIGLCTVEIVEPDVKFKIFNTVDISIDGILIIMEWEATPISDIVVASLMQTELVENTITATAPGAKSDRLYFKECLIETLQDMFGDNSVPNSTKRDNLLVTTNLKFWPQKYTINMFCGSKCELFQMFFLFRFSVHWHLQECV